jgi:hypothetical protein
MSAHTLTHRLGLWTLLAGNSKSRSSNSATVSACSVNPSLPPSFAHLKSLSSAHLLLAYLSLFLSHARVCASNKSVLAKRARASSRFLRARRAPRTSSIRAKRGRRAELYSPLWYFRRVIRATSLAERTAQASPKVTTRVWHKESHAKARAPLCL